MKFEWNSEKNEKLKRERNISFDEIATLLSTGVIWKIADHPHSDNYPNQRVFLIPINDWIYFVPFVIEKDTIFLKTAFPQRKATKEYLKEKHNGR
jgi:uncharacterized DUF497 family protein